MAPTTIAQKVGVCFLGILALTFFSTQLRADFIPAYGVPENGLFFPNNLPNRPAVTPVGTWTLSVDESARTFPASYIGTGSSQIVFHTGAEINHGFDSIELQFTHPIVASGMLSFDYSLSLRATGPAAGWNFGGYLLDGVLTQLPAGTGSISVPVNAGDVFGFETYASVNCILCEPPFNTAGEATLTITNFNAPIPEPATTALLVCGAGLALVRARLRKRD